MEWLMLNKIEIEIENKKNGYMSKIFNKNIVIRKKDKENIFIVGNSGFGKKRISLVIFNELIEKNLINEKTIVLTTYQCEEFLSILEKGVGRDLKGEDFVFFDLKGFEKQAEFNKIDFNSKVVQSALNKPTFLVNNYGTFFEDKVFQSILYNYFKKLPINKGKEIAIFIEDAEIFSYFKESSMFSMIEELNQKGYFVVACFKWVFKLNPLVKRLSNHLIIIKSIYNQSSIINLIKPNKIKTTVKNLEDGQYYYLDNFRLKKEKPVEIKDLNYNSINLVPNIETITEKIIKYKIGDF